MNYVEWLRVRNCLRVLAIVLGILVLGGLVVRVVTSEYANYDGWVAQLQQEPDTRVVRSQGPNGAERLTIDNAAKEVHVVVDDYGTGGKRTVITEPSSAHTVKMSMGNIDQVRHGNTLTTTVDTTGAVPMLAVMAFADVIALIIATCLGAALARENDGHLEIALTKPISREALALGTIGVDVAGIVASAALAIVAATVAIAFFGVPRFDLSGLNWQALVMGLVLPIAWYSLLCAATASIKRGYGAVMGFAWPVAIVICVLGQAPIKLGSSMLASALLGFFWLVSRIDPLSYFSFHAGGEAIQTGNYSASLNPTFESRITILLVLFIVYTVLAIVQWRRIEAT